MPDRNGNRNGGRPEFEVAYWTKELGKDLQRKMLRQQLAQFTDAGARGNGDDAIPDAADIPPAEDSAS